MRSCIVGFLTREGGEECWGWGVEDGCGGHGGFEKIAKC